MIRLLRLAACAYLMLSVPAAARADALDDVRQRGAIRWGGDQEGGGPYIYSPPDDPNRLVGFEVELMDALSARLGVWSEFQQCQWENLPNLLATGKIDVIVNGYELTQPRLAKMIATFPYYVYQLQLMARRDDDSIRSWDDLLSTQSGRKRVGVLGGSAAHNYVQQRFGDKIVIREYDGSTNAMRDVQIGNIDATVQDLPAAIFYGNRYPGLHFVDAPTAPGYYVIYLRPGDERLRDELNAGLLDLIHSGKLQAILEHYGLWNTAKEKLVEQSAEVHGWSVVRQIFRLLLQAAGMTVLITVLAMPLAIVVGLFVALGRLYGPVPLRWILTVYVEVLRGTPVLLQLFTIYYVIPPAFGFTLNPLVAAILGLAINYSAYESEIYRAGLLAVPVGQMEAALSLGMSRAAALRYIIVPQAVRLVIPPVTNDFIALFKDTSICSVITVVELSKRYSILVNNTNAYLELAVVTALLYLMMSYPLSLLARRLERKLPHVVV